MPKWRILIADDVEDIRTIVRGALATKYEVVEAHDGVDALVTDHLQRTPGLGPADVSDGADGHVRQLGGRGQRDAPQGPIIAGAGRISISDPCHRQARLPK